MLPNKDISYRVLHNLYSTLLRYNSNTSQKVSPPTGKLYDAENGVHIDGKHYLWNVDYIVSSIINSGNVGNIVNEFFKPFKGGNAIAEAITSRENKEEQKAVLYSIMTTLCYSLSGAEDSKMDETWKDAQKAVRFIAAASRFYKGHTLKVIEDASDLVFFLLTPQEFINLANSLQNEQIYTSLNQTNHKHMRAKLEKALLGSKSESVYGTATTENGRWKRDALRIGWWRGFLYEIAEKQKVDRKRARAERQAKKEAEEKKAEEHEKRVRAANLRNEIKRDNVVS